MKSDRSFTRMGEKNHILEPGHGCPGFQALQDPFGETQFVLHVPTINSGPDDQVVPSILLNDLFCRQFGRSVNIDRVGMVLLGITAFFSVEDRVGRNMNNTCSYRPALSTIFRVIPSLHRRADSGCSSQESTSAMAAVWTIHFGLNRFTRSRVSERFVKSACTVSTSGKMHLSRPYMPTTFVKCGFAHNTDWPRANRLRR